MIERSDAAKYAISAFYEVFNDIDIFVEDTAKGYEKIFANLLTTASNSRLSIDRVFPLGSRKTVVERANDYLHSKRERKSAFLIDGDLFLLSGELYEIPINIIVLPRYCVENFLIDERSFLEIMDEDHPTLAAEELRNIFDYSGWIDRSQGPLKSLFLAFAVSHSFGAGITTVSRGFNSICGNQYGEINSDKIEAICEEIYSKLVRRFGVGTVDKKWNAVLKKIDTGQCFLSTYVSAKDFLLPLFILRMKTITNIKLSNLNIKLRLSKKSNPALLSEVVRKISEPIPH